MPQTTPPQASVAKDSQARLRFPGTRKEDWIANQLRRVYDDALSEGIPQRMIDLLNALDESDTDDDEKRK